MKKKSIFLMSCTAVPLITLWIFLSIFSPAVKARTTTSIVVNTLADELNTDGDCSLREAITAANENTDIDACPAGNDVMTDTITFSVTGTIVLTQHEQLSIMAGGPVMIDGGDVITVRGEISSSAYRIFNVDSEAVAVFSSFTVAKGSIILYIGGAGINNDGGVVTLNNMTVISNSVADIGGGVYNNGGIMTINNSTIIGNSAVHALSGNGGGIANSNNGTMTVNNSYFSANAADEGGGISNRSGSVLTITNSTVNENSASLGGGIYNQDANITIINSTISRNQAWYIGGGIASRSWSTFYPTSTVTLKNSTISENSAQFGGGIVVISDTNPSESSLAYEFDGSPRLVTLTATNITVINNTASSTGGGLYTTFPLTLTNSIIAHNTNGDCYGPIISLGYNLAGDTTCNFSGPGDLNNTDPQLGPLQNNGGWTSTHLPLVGSPAID